MSEYSTENMITLAVNRMSVEFDEIIEWAKSNDIIISTHENSPPLQYESDHYRSGHSRCIIKNEDQVVLFLLRWGHLVIGNNIIVFS